MQAALERWRGGDLTAYIEAVWLYWQQHPDQFPYELVKASEAVVEAAMAETEKRARRDWRIALTRWEAVTELPERRHELARAGGANLKRARELISSQATDAQERARLVELWPELVEVANDDRGMSMENARDAVSKVLEKTKAAGTASAIKFSYELVESAGGEHATFENFLIARRERRLKAERKDQSKTRRKRRSG
jgi:hypothetical protein